jgi:hypothetical protein
MPNCAAGIAARDAAWAAAGIKLDMTGKRALFVDVNYEVSTIADTGIVMALAPRVGFIF